MFKAPARFTLIGSLSIMAACSEDNGAGTQPEQDALNTSPTSSQPAPPSSSTASGPGSTSTQVPTSPPGSGTTQTTSTSSQAGSPQLDPTATATETPAGGTGASSGTAAPTTPAASSSDDGDDAAGGAGGSFTGGEDDEMGFGGAGSDDAETGDDDMEMNDDEATNEGAMPSSACGSGAGMPNLNLQNTLVSIPNSYDGTTPLPVVIAFHAAGNGNDQMRSIIGATFQDEYIMLYPKSGGNEWNNQADPPKVDAIFDALDQSACYDKNRVFAAGHSSGAQFIVQRLCAGESRWRAVSPVASSVYCSSWDPIPALVIHGIGDREREAYGLNDGDGEKDIVPYRTSNSCSETFTRVEVDGCMSGGVNVDPGCRDFDGCVERTRWCQHTDPQYDTSHHGVPCFGARVMKEFFDMYR